MIGSDVPPLAPIHFFCLHTEIPQGGPKHIGKAHLLPDTSALLGEDHFADVRVAWVESGLFVNVHVHKSFEEASYPKFAEGDAIELFLDTRDLKDAGFPTRFCHHFLILPQEVQGVRALELTRFRTEESHPLCSPEKIEITFRASSREYFLDLFFPTDILYGYDPHNFDRLGLTYTIHRPKGSAQNFAVSSQYVAIAQHPSLWASCKLKKVEK